MKNLIAEADAHAGAPELQTQSVDKIVCKAPAKTLSCCSVRKKLPSLKLWQHLPTSTFDSSPQFLTIFVDKIVSNALALAQTL
ncbi:MAG TPA: hypothetical protein VF861_09585 [Telluria sp.]